MWQIITIVLTALQNLIPQLASACTPAPAPSPAPSTGAVPQGFDPNTPITNEWALEIACQLSGVPVAVVAASQFGFRPPARKQMIPAAITPVQAASIVNNPSPIQSVRGIRTIKNAVNAAPAGTLPNGQTYDDVVAFLQMKAATSAATDMPALFTEAGYSY